MGERYIPARSAAVSQPEGPAPGWSREFQGRACPGPVVTHLPSPHPGTLPWVPGPQSAAEAPAPSPLERLP